MVIFSRTPSLTSLFTLQHTEIPEEISPSCVQSEASKNCCRSGEQRHPHPQLHGGQWAHNSGAESSAQAEDRDGELPSRAPAERAELCSHWFKFNSQGSQSHFT